ncbi:cell division protein ZapE [Marinomonas piezotolerans]|nr:cell division protein ZapE [Marinomonas piezotolerans]
MAARSMNTDSPKEYYKHRIALGALDVDPLQYEALEALDNLYQKLVFSDVDCQQDSMKGVYLWGDVGRGKTMLMDLFFESLPAGMGKRQHFHHFMADLHRQLNTTFGVVDPLKKIAANMAKTTKVICFDEFHVSDIADAMLLRNLIEALFDNGVVLVATSNIAVENLFQSQLQKARFEPAIRMLKQHLIAFNLNGQTDYRYRLPLDRPLYFTHLSELERVVLRSLHLTSHHQDATVNGRSVPVQGVLGRAIWCDFASLCEGARSTQDYIALAHDYDVVIVSDIPELSSEPYEHIKARGTEDGALGSGETGERRITLGVNDDAVRRFIALVDECYDQGVSMAFQASVELDQLYSNGSLSFEFRRTVSRINEMQTLGYRRRSELLMP